MDFESGNPQTDLSPETGASLNVQYVSGTERGGQVLQTSSVGRVFTETITVTTKQLVVAFHMRATADCSVAISKATNVNPSGYQELASTFEGSTSKSFLEHIIVKDGE